MTIEVGLIGAGFMGRAVAESLMAESPDIHVSAVYDPAPDAIDNCRQAFGDTFQVCGSTEEVVRDPAIDWVMIASWNCFHAEQAIAAFRAGKHVFCQKPLAISMEECLAMRSAWRASGREFVIGFNLRYSPHYRLISEIVQRGDIGRIVSLEFNETLHFNHGGFIMSDWRRFSRFAGSHLLEKCSHDIDLSNWITGARARRVASFAGINFFNEANIDSLARAGRSRSGRQAYMSWRGSDRENPFSSDKDIVDNQVIIIEYDNDVRATLHLNSNTAIPERRMYICGSEGTLRADLYRDNIEVQRIGYGQELQLLRTPEDDIHGGGDRVLARELAATMLSGAAVSTTLDDGLNAAVTCFAIDEAERLGTVVDCAPYWEQVDK